MLQSHVKKDGELKTHGYLIAVETQDDVNPDEITRKLADSLAWVEGVGTIDVEYLGEIDIADEETSKAN